MVLGNRTFVFNLFLIALTWSFSWFGLSHAEKMCKQGLFKQIKGDCFTNLLSSHHANSMSECGQRCVRVDACVGFKYHSTIKNYQNCKVLKKIESCSQRGNNINSKSWKLYKSIKKPSSTNNVCKNGGSFVERACSNKGFECICSGIFNGKFCEEATGIFTSCKELLQADSNLPSGVYTIETKNGTELAKTYCQMTSLEGCAGGGWTMVMKINGYKGTFYYTSLYWSNKVTFNPIGGASGFDDVETKLATYWSTSFNELCVGMKVGNNLKFLTIPFAAPSLYSLIADGRIRRTNVGKPRWKSLIPGSSLQTFCNLEGFNLINRRHVWPSVRLGIVANEQNDCLSPDSYLGLGLSNYTLSPTAMCYIDGSNTPSCGNVGTCGADNGKVKIKSIGYVLVR